MNSQTKTLMRQKTTFSNLLLMLLLLTVTGNAFASTTRYVNGLHGSDSYDCKSLTTACKTIHHAIGLASSGDSIMVAAATYTENLTISKSLQIIGSGASTTILNGGGAGTVVVTIPNTSTSVVLSKMTISNGRALYSGGVSNSGTLMITHTTISGNQASCAMSNSHSAGGGGISNGGTLTIYNSTISGNGASCVFRQGGATASGGGISNGGTLKIDNSTISGNVTVASAFNCYRFMCHPISLGGGVFNLGTLTITNSTLSGNSARGFGYVFGGGIYNSDNGNAALSSNTISGNSADGGGGVFNANATVVLRNTIVANNSGGNCSGYGAPITSNGYNLSSDNTCNFHDSGDRNHIDPKLGPLQNNGGPTWTMALLPGSAAIDAGNPSGCTDGSGHLLTKDQRGMPRPDKDDTKPMPRCDMGAYESD